MTVHTTHMKARTRPGLRQAIASGAVFAIVLGALVFVDERVHEGFRNLVTNGNGVSSWVDRATDLASTLVSAARHQSIENAPLVIFAAVGAVLVLFMVRT